MGKKKREMAAGGRTLSNGVSELKFSCQIRKACRIIDDALEENNVIVREVVEGIRVQKKSVISNGETQMIGGKMCGCVCQMCSLI